MWFNLKKMKILQIQFYTEIIFLCASHKFHKKSLKRYKFFLHNTKVFFWCKINEIISIFYVSLQVFQQLLMLHTPLVEAFLDIQVLVYLIQQVISTITYHLHYNNTWLTICATIIIWFTLWITINIIIPSILWYILVILSYTIH